MKKILSLILTIVMLVGIIPALPITVSAETDSTLLYEAGVGAMPPPTEAPSYLWEANFEEAYNQAQDGLIEYDALTETLHMKKSGTESGFCSINWSDDFDNASHPASYTLFFEAKMTGGYAGNTWDGYAVSIRHEGGSSDTEIIRLAPADGGGTDLYVGGPNGTKVATVTDSLTHRYEVIFDEAEEKILSVKVDGAEKLQAPLDWTAPASYHGIMIKSGHMDATNCELWMSSLSLASFTGENLTYPATEGPTEAPTTVLTMNSAPYNDNGANSENTTFSDGVLSMTKTGTSLYNVLVWADEAMADFGADTTYTLEFNASVSGGYGGNSWDGYAVALRNKAASTYELIRLFPTEDGRTGITIGAGNSAMATVAAGGHHYDIVFNAASATIYCDGTEVASTDDLGFGGELHAFQIQSGHNEATGCSMVMNVFTVYAGEQSCDGEFVSPEPTEEVTQPPVTEPPVTEEPVTEPPVTMPPITEVVPPPTVSVESGVVPYGTVVQISPSDGHIAYQVNGGEWKSEYLEASVTIKKDTTLTVTSWKDAPYPYIEYVYEEATYTYTVDPATYPTESPDYLWVADFEEAYNQIQDGTIEYDALTETLYMKKSGTQVGYCSINWSDAFDDAEHPASYTLRFNAKLSGGYEGNPADGYAVCIRHTGGSWDTEVIRLAPANGGGTDLYIGGPQGTKVATITDTLAHNYEVIFDEEEEKILSVKVDGAEKLYAPLDWTAPSSYHGIMIKSGHNDATSCELWMKDLSINTYTGPTPELEPTENPFENPTPVLTMNSAPYNDNGANSENTTYSWNDILKSKLTMTKTGTGLYDVLVWADAIMPNFGSSTTYTLEFNASVSGGLAGNSWDGYSVALRNTDSTTYELIRLFPMADGRTGITIGAGNGARAAVSAGSHHYDVVFSGSRVTVYCDSFEIVSKDLDFEGHLHAFQIQSGHNDATGCSLEMKRFTVYTGELICRDGIVTHEPSEDPTEYPEVPQLLAEYDLSDLYEDGLNGTNSYADGVLTMTKDIEGSNYQNIIWSDSADVFDSEETMMLLFDAKVSGGYQGYVNTWDGYALSLRRPGASDVELVRITPTATGVAITRGAGGEVLATVAGTGYHAYSCEYNKFLDTISVYVDGEKVIDSAALGWYDSTQNGFILKSGHNDATGCTLKIADMELWWNGQGPRTAPGSYDGTTDAPPTEGPMDYTGKVPVEGIAYVDAQMYPNQNTTGFQGRADGEYTLDANTGDASLYMWADAQVQALDIGVEVMLSFTIDVPETNEVSSEEHGVQIGYMDRDRNGTGIYTFPKGATYDCQLALIPDGDNTDYILIVDDVQVATGTLLCTRENLWNICWRTYWAGNTNTTATVRNISSSDIGEWVYPEGVTAPPVTEEPPATDVPAVTEDPLVTEAPTGEEPTPDCNYPTEDPFIITEVVPPPTVSVESGVVPYGTVVYIYPSDGHIGYQVNGGRWESEYLEASVTIVEDTTLTVTSWKDAPYPYIEYVYEEATYTYTVDPATIPTEEPTEPPVTEAPGTEAPGTPGTEEPTAEPTEVPTEVPTEAPGTEEPTAVPTDAPTEEVTSAPTDAPTAVPTQEPTAAPTKKPTYYGGGGGIVRPTAAPTAAPTEIPTEAPTQASMPFGDVSESDWYFDAVSFAYKSGLMNGVAEDEFSPNSTITRAMFVTVLYRMAGEPTAEGALPFKDISAESYYEKAVLWATENGIVSGISETAFAPDAEITREQMATMIYRYAKLNGASSDGTSALDFADKEDVSDYAHEALAWCNENGIILGMDGNMLCPLELSTRAQAATIFMRIENAL